MIRKLASLAVLTPGAPVPEVEERELIRDLAIRHFVLFRRHFQEEEASRELVRVLRTLPGEPGYLMVDQEGGRVQRIGPPLAPEFPEPLTVARKGPEEIRTFSRELARTVKQWSLSVNLAPVLDLAGEEAPDFLRGRTLGENPEKVGELGRLFIRGHLEEEVLPCAKHFPGLGGVERDPHRELPRKKEVSAADLLPFREALKEGLPLIMTTHLLVQEWGDYPVTFSPQAVKVLREELGFSGLVLTDDLAMGALSSYELPERFLLALLSGHDLWLYCGNLPEACSALEELAREVSGSRVLRERLAETVERVQRRFSGLTVKIRYNRPTP